MTTEKYIPSARDTTFGRFGRDSYGFLRQHCNNCHDKHPLAGYDGRTEPDRIIGERDLDSMGTDQNSGSVDVTDACDVCGVLFIEIAKQCQREHDEQQARWAKQPVTALVEYGIPAGVRCRIY